MKRWVRLDVWLVTLSLAAAGAGAQEQEPKTVRIDTLNVMDTLYHLSGGGANSLALIDEINGGVVLIDTKRRGWGQAVRNALDGVTDLPVTTIINTRAHPELVVDRWPDKENRTEPEIDAVAGDFAIEHTSVDSVTDQRQRSASYLRVVGGLDPLLKKHVGCGFTVTLEFDAIGRGLDWSRARASLEKWIEEEAPLLQDGSHEVVLPASDPTEVPIVMYIQSGSDLVRRHLRR